MQEKQKIYFDNAATTKIDDKALAFIQKIERECYGNASSFYSIGGEARKVVEKAREQVAAALGCEKNEIYFTSGGTEADNWAVKGFARANKSKGKHIVSTMIEHHAVLHTLEALEKEGFEVTLVKPDENGIVSAQTIKAALRGDTILITVMYANNEIGTIQPIAEIGKLARECGITFHTDAVQAVGSVEIDVKAQNIDMLSLSAHKLYGPKGAGALYVKKGLRLENLMDGGAQEKGKRAGTENVPAIAGLGLAAELACADMEAKNVKIKSLRDRLIDGVLKISYTRLNGDREKRLPGNANFSIEYIEGEAILLSLDLKGICASSGSACTSGSLDPSHVLLAIGLSHEVAHGSLRITIGKYNIEEEIDYILEVLPEIVQRLRDMSPVWEKADQNI